MVNLEHANSICIVNLCKIGLAITIPTGGVILRLENRSFNISAFEDHLSYFQVIGQQFELFPVIAVNQTDVMGDALGQELLHI